MLGIAKKISRFTGLCLVVCWVVAMGAGAAFAALKDVGPVDVTNGYPVWYRDTSTTNTITIPPNPEQTFPQGLPLQLCLSQALSPVGGGAFMCNLLPVPGFIPENPIIFPSNFPDEGFWFAADSVFTGTGDIGDALIVLGLEAAFAGGGVVPGDQISFARVRIRIDVNTPGDYRITHPYGVETFTNVPAGTRTINFTSDIGIGAAGDFTGALGGAIGPFLRWDTDFPVIVGDEAFIGDPNVLHTITGSPFGTNFFRVERIDAQGNALSSQQSDLFAVTGKIYTTPIASPLTVTRASYARNADFAQIDVFAAADVVSNSPPALSALEISGANIPTTVMETDGAGNFFAHIDGLVPADIPASITVTNVGDVPPKIVEVQVTDEVTSAATYDPASSVLHIEASSSDNLTPPDFSTDFGNLVDGVLDVPNIVAPPAFLLVSSSQGGSDREPVIIPLPNPVSAATLVADVTSPKTVGTQVNFTAGAEGGTGNYEFQFWVRDPAGVWTHDPQFSPVNTKSWNTTGLATGQWVVSVRARNVGSSEPYEALARVFFTLVAPPPPVTAVTLVADPVPPQTAGAQVLFTAQAAGGSGNYEYQYWVMDPAGNWSHDPVFSQTNTMAWDTTGLAPGQWVVAVRARSVGSIQVFEALNRVYYRLLAAP